jgi:hypothetical protein
MVSGLIYVDFFGKRAVYRITAAKKYNDGGSPIGQQVLFIAAVRAKHDGNYGR